MMNRKSNIDLGIGSDSVDRLLQDMLERHAPPPGKEREIEERLFGGISPAAVWNGQLSRLIRRGFRALDRQYPFDRENVS